LSKSVRPPAVLKRAESIAAWERDDKPAAIEEALLKTALDGTYGQIVCVGVAVDNEPPITIESDSSDPLTLEHEMGVLRNLFAWLRANRAGTHGLRPTIVGHNLIGFDLPFLWRRSVVHGLRPPFWLPRNPKPWAEGIADTMLMWAGDRGTIGMDRLCRVLGVAGKGDISGADVWPLVQAGNLAEVAAYCRDDVERTRALYRRMTFAEAAE